MERQALLQESQTFSAPRAILSFYPLSCRGLFGSKPGLESPRYSTRAVYYSHGTCGLLWVGRHHVGDLCLKLVSKGFGHILQQTLTLIQKDGGFMTTLLSHHQLHRSETGSSVLTMFLLSIPFFCKDLGAFRSCCFKNQSNMSSWSAATLATARFRTQSCKTRNSLTNMNYFGNIWRGICEKVGWRVQN